MDAERVLPPPAPDPSQLELRAAEWIAPYSQAEHLVRARDWVVALDPGASPALRLAALTHDIERYFPEGSPHHDHAADDWDDPDYLFAHSIRSADIVQTWLADGGAQPDAAFVAEVRKLILLHELGGYPDADLIQAADSLSWLETLQDLAVGWVENGRCSAEKAEAKLVYMRERIRVPRARELAQPLFDEAVARLPRRNPRAG
jgi:hypothetical protein